MPFIRDTVENNNNSPLIGHYTIKQRSLLGKMMTHKILSSEFGISPDAIKIITNEHNKPALESQSNIHFNLSHSGDWVIAAFSSKPIGIDDMLKWERAWSNNLLISDSLRNCAFTKAETGKKRLHDYGMGWRFAEIDLKPVIFHNGLWNGFTTSLHRFVEDSITVIVLNNTNGKAPVLARQLYTKALKEIEAVKNLPKAEDRLLAQDSSFFMK